MPKLRRDFERGRWEKILTPIYLCQNWGPHILIVWKGYLGTYSTAKFTPKGWGRGNFQIFSKKGSVEVRQKSCKLLQAVSNEMQWFHLVALFYGPRYICLPLRLAR